MGRHKKVIQGVPNVVSPDTDLEKFVTFGFKSKIPDSQFRELVQRFNGGGGKQDICRQMQISEGRYASIRSELFRAFRSGYKDVNQYLAANRPCQKDTKKGGK